MKFPTNKIEAAVSPEQSRYTLNAVRLDVEAKKLIATDGHILAAIPVAVDETDHSANIGVDAIKVIRSVAKQQKFEPTVNVNGKIEVVGLNTRSEHPTVEGQFPNWKAVLPTTLETANNQLLELLKSLAIRFGNTLDCSTDSTDRELGKELHATIQNLEAKSKKPTISFNVDLLSRLTDALRSEPSKAKQPRNISLWIKDENSAVLVKSNASVDSESVGVMMPVRA